MRRWLATLAIAMPAAAAPPARATWSDWVGTYTGNLAWRSCTAPGEKQGGITLAAVDGSMAIELDKAHTALRTISLVETEDHAWSGLQGDLRIVVQRPKPNTVDVTLVLESGCSMTGHLVRASTKVAACDRLVGAARIEAACKKRGDDPPTEDLAKLVAAVWRAKDATSCKARTEKLEEALVDAGCLPLPDPTIGVRAKDCLALAGAADRFGRCGNAPPALRDLRVERARALAAAATTASKAELPIVEAQCRDEKAELAAIATNLRCP